MARPLRQQARREAGAIALIAAPALFLLIVLTTGALTIGLLVFHQCELYNIAEAVAMANGLQVLSQPTGSATQNPVMAQSFITSNSVESTNHIASSLINSVPTQNGPSVGPAGAGGGFVTVTGTQAPLLSFFGGNIALNAQARSVVNQYQWNSFKLSVPNVVLVLDFSHSMRLPMPGGDSSSIQLLKNEVTNLLNDSYVLKNQVALGLVLFADTIPAQSQVRIPGSIQNIKTALAQKTFGQGTDMATAIDAAHAMLPNPQDNLSQKGMMIIVSDGEPDTLSSTASSTNQSASGYDGRVATASAAAVVEVQNAWHQDYINTQTVLIENIGVTENNSAEVEGFMASVSGGCDINGPCGVMSQNSNVMTTPQDFNNIFIRIIHNIPCVTTQLNIPANSWMLGPPSSVEAKQLLYAYWIPSRYYREIPLKQCLSQAALMGQTQSFYYDTQANVVMISADLCQQYLNPTGGKKNPELRVRWGLPRLWVP